MDTTGIQTQPHTKPGACRVPLRSPWAPAGGHPSLSEGSAGHPLAARTTGPVVGPPPPIRAAPGTPTLGEPRHAPLIHDEGQGSARPCQRMSRPAPLRSTAHADLRESSRV